MSTERFSKVQYSNVNKPTFQEGLPQIFAVYIKNVLLFSSTLIHGFPTILIPGLSGRDPNEKIRLDVDGVSWISPIILISMSLAAVLSGPLSQKFGRKRCMQLLTIPLLMSWMILYFSTEAWHVFLALSLSGLSGGLLEAPISTYVVEITQPHLRGILSTSSILVALLAILVQFILGTLVSWRNAALISSVMPIISLILLFFIPESHVWLMAKDRPVEAKRSLAWLRRWSDGETIEREFSDLWGDIVKEKEREDSESTIDSIIFLKKKENYLPFSLLAFIFALQQFSGYSSVSTYAIPLFSTLRTPIDAYYATVILGIMPILGSIVCMSFINVLGKRIITFISLSGLSVCSLIVAIYIYAYDILYLNYTKTQDATKHWIPAVFLLLISFSAYVGISSLPWNLQGEVFSHKDRAKAAGLVAATGNIISSGPRKMFPNMVTLMTLPGAFLFYSMVALCGIVVLGFLLPETEGKTLHEISDHYRGKKKLSNRLERKSGIQVNSEAEASDELNFSISS